jgi:protease-4
MDLSPHIANQPAMPHQPQVVHVAARPGGLWSALGFVAGLFFFGVALVIGIIFGVAAMMAGSSIDTVVLEQTYRDGGRDKIVIIPVEGVIDERQAESVHAAVNHVLEDRQVRGVVLRVNSPGGGVTASDEIWYQIERLKQARLPVVASYGGVAASGGYYISCAADHIMAQETCITGSIGVIAQIFTMEGLMDKVGIQPVTLVATDSPEKATGNDMFRQWNEHDQKKILTMLDAAYEIFNRRVSDGRGHVITDTEQLNGLANGSIYTAQEALDGGLIDSIGYLDDAIAQLERMANLTPGRATVVRLARPPSLFGGLLAQGSAKTSPNLFDADAVRGLINDLNAPRVMYLMR